MGIKYSYLGTVAADDTNARDADAMVDAVLLSGGGAAILSNGTLLWTC